LKIAVDKINVQEILSNSIKNSGGIGLFWAYVEARDNHDAQLETQIADLESQLADATKPVEAPTIPDQCIKPGRYRLKPDGAECKVTNVTPLGFVVKFDDGKPHEITVQREDASPETYRLTDGFTHSDWASYFEPIPATPTAPECPFKVGDWVRWSASCDTGATALVLDVNKEAFWRSFCEPTLKSFRASQLRTRVQQSEWSDYTKVDAPAWADEAISYAREKGLINAKIAELLGNAAPVEVPN
jgi:hypothetical protein